MSFNTRTIFKLTSLFVALAANACAVRGVRPAASAHADVTCVGGSIETAADATLYGACEHVNGDLRVSAPELSDLSALSALRSVSGKLEISGNTGLSDLSGLEGLERVGQLSVHDNGELASLRGLEGLEHADSVVIAHNGIYQTAGLSGLSEVGSLIVEDNAKLNSLVGLGTLSHAGSVTIRNNPRLCAKGMLPALARVEHELTVSRNRAVTKPELDRLLARVDHATRRPSADLARMEASLR